MSVTHIGQLLRGERAFEALFSGIILEGNNGAKIYRFNKESGTIQFVWTKDYKGGGTRWSETAWSANKLLTTEFHTWCEYKAGDMVVIIDGGDTLVRKVERVVFDSIALGGYQIYTRTPAGSEVRWRVDEISRKATEEDVKAFEYVTKLEQVFRRYGRKLYEWKNGDIVIDLRDNKTYKVESDDNCPEGVAPVTEFGVENASVIYLTDSVLKPVYMVDNMIL